MIFFLVPVFVHRVFIWPTKLSGPKKGHSSPGNAVQQRECSGIPEHQLSVFFVNYDIFLLIHGSGQDHF